MWLFLSFQLQLLLYGSHTKWTRRTRMIKQNFCDIFKIPKSDFDTLTWHLAVFRRRNTLTYQSTVVFWREVLSAHNRKFHGCSSFQLLTKRLWPRAVPWARIKILSDEIVSANRLAYPSGKARPKWRSARESDYEETKLGGNAKKERRLLWSAQVCAGRRVREPSFLEEGNWERKCLSKARSKRTVDCPTRDRNTIQRRASSSSNFAEDIVASRSAQLLSQRSDGVSKKNICVCSMPRSRNVQKWNKAEPRLTKSPQDTADYDRSPCETIDRSTLLRFLGLCRPCCGWNITLVVILFPQETETSHMREESCVAISYSEI